MDCICGCIVGRLIKLSDRLSAVAGFVEPGASVVDVGTDHGFLPVYLAQSGLASKIIASDIGIGPLGSARRSAKRYDVMDKITFVASSGLAGIVETDVDTVVIAGLGGETIAGILSDAPWTRFGVRLILQPQSKIGELCGFLRENGYVLRDAKLVRDSGKLYVVLLACGKELDAEHPCAGAREALFEQPPEMELLALLKERRDPLFEDYMDWLIAITCRAMDGMKNSCGASEAYPEMSRKLEILMRSADRKESE